MKFLLLFSFAATILASAFMAHAQDYRIRPGDTLQIEVLEDPSLNRSVPVLPNGQISFPFAGTLRVNDLTIVQVETAISAAIRSNFALPPTVFVGVTPRPVLDSTADAAGESDGPEIDIYFLGEVNGPGKISVAPGTTLLQAVAVKGGLSRFAATKRIQLRRTGANGVQNVTILNYKALSDGASATDIEMKDGDVILVPERRLFE